MKAFVSLRSGLLAIASVSLLVACAPESPTVGSEEQSSRKNPIIGGTPATGYPESVLIDMSQNGQIVAACSGSVIAPRVVLTAGHCVQGMTGWYVTAPYAQNQTAQSTSAKTYDWNVTTETVDPNKHDIGLVFLDSDITLSSYPSLATAAIASGTKIQDIGRINNGSFSDTALFIGPQTAANLGTNYGYPYSYESADVIQSGDSGGPVVLPGTHKIVAVNSGAGGGTQVLARVDLLSSWIAQQIGAHPSTSPPPSTPPTTNPPSTQPPPTNPPSTSPPSPQNPCGSVTYEGDCKSGVLEWCENNRVNKINCSASGLSCGYDASNQFYNCL